MHEHVRVHSAAGPCACSRIAIPRQPTPQRPTHRIVNRGRKPADSQTREQQRRVVAGVQVILFGRSIFAPPRTTVRTTPPRPPGSARGPTPGRGPWGARRARRPPRRGRAPAGRGRSNGTSPVPQTRLDSRLPRPAPLRGAGAGLPDSRVPRTRSGSPK